MITLLRFFASRGQLLCKYSDENIVIPRNGDIVFHENDAYVVKQATYDYDDSKCNVDISLEEVGKDFWNDIDDDKFECDGECGCCELNDVGMDNNNDNEYNELKEAYDNAHAYLDGVKDLFNHLGYDFKFDIEIGKEL